MSELFRFLRLIPVQIRWLGTFFVVASMVFLLGRYFGMSLKVRGILVLGILLIFLVLALVNYFFKAGRKKKGKKFDNELGLQGQDADEAVRELQDRWRNAVKELQHTGHSLYDLPWFLLIGEPQSGKSTTLKESGLEFPIGTESLSGAAGTRNCDWWFTEEAVILDTAGRFTFQEDEAPDRHEWEAFLKLLRRHRKYCPINGVIVVIPATSLIEDPLEVQEDKARNIQKKLMHLQKVLEIRFPIYILVTKADRILGFTEFFNRLRPDERGQLFGWSNPEQYDRTWDPKTFPDIFREIVDRMHRRRVKLMGDEPETGAIDKLFVFPEELAALEEPLANYLHLILSTSRFQEPFIFRGFYLTSGIQQGRPIARACQDLLRVQVGDPQAVLEDLESVFHTSRAFFISDFYEKKLFPEQGLIARTKAALKKERTYRWVMRGLMAAGVVLAFLLLLPAILNLQRVLKPINEAVKRSQTCLDPQRECTVGEAYELIEDLEKERLGLQQSRWGLRFLLKSGSRNEISEKLVPAVQAGLLRLRILPHLLASFEARSDAQQWALPEPPSYADFYPAFEEYLRFKAYEGTLDADREQLRSELGIDGLLAFVRSMPGQDPSPKGEEIDEWLDGDFDMELARQVFGRVFATRPDFDVADVDVAKPVRSLRAFEAYWSVANLARWETDLIEDYLRAYQTVYGEMLALTTARPAYSSRERDVYQDGGEGDPYEERFETTPAADSTLETFARQAESLQAIWDEGAAYMASRGGGRPAQATEEATEEERDEADEEAVEEEAEASEDGDLASEAAGLATGLTATASRPGLGVDAWERNCRQDYEALDAIYDPLASRDVISTVCSQEIPEDWTRLTTEIADFAYLYDVETGRGTATYRWSEAAQKLKEPLVALGALADPQTAAAEAQEFSQRLESLGRDDERLKEIARFSEEQERTIGAPGASVAEFAISNPDPAFRAREGSEMAADVARLALGQRIVEPVARYFTERAFADPCDGCYSAEYARTFVPAANDFLSWARSRRIDDEGVARVDQAEYDYLERFIDREGGGGGGGGGGGFARPTAAARADAWPEFVRAIQRWNVIATASAPSAVRTPGGLTLSLLEDFARGNDRLNELKERFRRQTSRAPAAPVQVPRELEDAANAFKRCVEVLDDRPLEAWKQLAQGRDGASLADFHAFSTNRRLRGISQASYMAEEVEGHGARLLVQEIRPEFEDRFFTFWRRIDRCCRDRFPFISQAQLRRDRESYNFGYRRNEAGVWGEQEKSARQVTNWIQLETLSLDDVDDLFFEGGSLDDLIRDFALTPILEGRETVIDFVGEAKDKLRTLDRWQRFLYGGGADERQGRRGLATDRTFEIRILEQVSREPGREYLGQRMGQVDLFGNYPIRPSTDANRGRVLTIPLAYDDRQLLVTGRNEEDVTGWQGRLGLKGGPLKLLYFVHVASLGDPREDDQVWTVRLELPDYERPDKRLEAVFELRFDRSLPGVFLDLDAEGGGRRGDDRDGYDDDRYDRRDDRRREDDRRDDGRGGRRGGRR